MRRTRKTWSWPARYTPTTGQDFGWTSVPVIPSWIRSRQRSPSGAGGGGTGERPHPNKNGPRRDAPGRGSVWVEPTREGERPAPDAPIDRGASTMVPELVERYRADGQEFTPIEVPVWTLAQVVAEHVS